MHPPAFRLWLVMLLLAVFLLWWLKCLKPPWKTAWAEEALAGHHTFKTCLRVGLWYGTLAHLAILTLLLATLRWWGAKGGARFDVTLGSARQPWRKSWFVAALFLLCAAAGWVRWPKMSQSYWGDEGWALAPYVYGKHVPVKAGDFQGAMEHKPVTWQHTAFDDHTCGNHYFFSLCQRATLETWHWWRGLPAEAFDETVSRLPPLAAGLASIPVLAAMMAWLGRPGAGLAAALMLALHPWHVRYSTEARGYTLMLLFLILAVWAALAALKHGQWRWWLAFGAAEFLCMYSWKGAMYPLALLNLLLLIWIITARPANGSNLPANAADRRTTAARLLLANGLAAGLFINLTLPCVLQVKDAKQHLVQLNGRPMNRHWLDNSLSLILTGMHWHVEERENPTEVVLSTQLEKQPLRSRLELAALAGLLFTGTASLASRHRWQAGLWLSMLVAGAAGAACFRWIIHAEWISWYFFFMLLPLAVFTGLGMDSARQWLGRAFSCSERASTAPRFAAALCMLLPPAAFADLAWPAVSLMRRQAYEDHRGAFLATRGRHEPLHHKEPSKIHTIHLWRHISLYDPRADTHVRNASDLRDLIARVEAEEGELYVVVGHRRLARVITPDLMTMIEDPNLFEPIATFWAPEELHCLHCFRYLHLHSGDPDERISARTPAQSR